MNSKKAIVSAAEFAAAIKKVSAVLKKSVIPILEQVCVEFEGNVCRLKATDLSVYMTAEIPTYGDSFSFVFTNTANIVRACAHYTGDLTMEMWDIFPKVVRESYYIDRAKYLDTLKYLGEFTRGSDKARVRFERGMLWIYDKKTDSRYNAKIKTDGGCEIPYVFELKYMKEALEQFAGEKYLRIDVSGETTPLVLSAEGAMKALILPVRVFEGARDAA